MEGSGVGESQGAGLVHLSSMKSQYNFPPYPKIKVFLPLLRGLRTCCGPQSDVLVNSCCVCSEENTPLDLDDHGGRTFLRVLLHLTMHDYPPLVSGALQLLFRHFSQRQEVLQAFKQVPVCLERVIPPLNVFMAAEPSPFCATNGFASL